MTIADLNFAPTATTVSLGELLSFAGEGNPQLQAAFENIANENAGIGPAEGDGFSLPFSGLNTGPAFRQDDEAPGLLPWLLVGALVYVLHKGLS